MPEPTLFIGGVHDGEWITVSEDRTLVQFPIDDGHGRFKHECYRRETLMGASKSFHVFVESSMTGDHAMRALIQNYQPTEAPDA